MTASRPAVVSAERLAAREASALAVLRDAAASGRAAFSTSLGAEDMVVLDLIRRHALPIRAFTLDTGRLHDETYELLARVETRYGRVVDVFFPEAEAVQALVARQGVNGFRASVEQRKACCAVRKLEPLGRALEGATAWVTGLRAAQSAGRAATPAREHDAERSIDKFNPLHDWSEADVWSYVAAHDVPYNVLHDRFFPSIGCAPCTRAITPGEDIRAGRWWWEQESGKECGLHARDAVHPIVFKETTA